MDCVVLYKCFICHIYERLNDLPPSLDIADLNFKVWIQGEIKSVSLSRTTLSLEDGSGEEIFVEVNEETLMNDVEEGGGMVVGGSMMVVGFLQSEI